MTKNNVELIKIDSFVSLSRAFYYIIGIIPYKNLTTLTFPYELLRRIRFIFNFVQINVAITCMCLHVYKALSSFATFLEFTALAPSLGYCMLGQFKVILLWISRKTIGHYMNEMSEYFPKTLKEQQYFKIRGYKLKSSLSQTFFWKFHLIVLFSFLISAGMQTLIETWFLKMPMIYRLPFFFWYPFEINTNLRYIMAYIQQVCCGLIAVFGTLAADLQLIGMAMLCCMQFNSIQISISKLKANDIQELLLIIRKHQNILRLSEDINNTYSIIVLCNLLTSSIIVCLTGFQAVSTPNIIDVWSFILFLIVTLIQLFILCYLGQQLMESSTGVADAAYNHLWYEGNIKYQKMIFLIIIRAQKPAMINAKGFSIVSLNTYSQVLGISYKFFTLLRTIYNPKE